MLTAVDLFAGAGGLSLGARWAGFDVPVAVEVDPEVTATYRENHHAAVVLERDVRKVTGSQILESVPSGRVNLLMGCAPCQGFCSLTSKLEREDARNQLLIEMARLVEEISPDAVLMENVPGLALRGRHFLTAFIKRLKEAGYLTQWSNVQMADYGVPQNRRRLVLLAGRGFTIKLPDATHAKDPGQPFDRKRWKTLRDVIHGERFPKRLSQTRKLDGPRAADWHVVRDILPATKARLQATAAGQMRLALDDALLPECHQGGYEGFRNVYMRMSWDIPSPTITAGCTTPAKGRFGHPDRRRTTISVREAAMIQTFPTSFCFATDKIDVACEMVGNAVPPLFAKTLAAAAHGAISIYRGGLNRKD